MMAFFRLFSQNNGRDQIPDSNPEFEQEWRKIAWGDRNKMLNALRTFKPNSKVSHLNILLHGPVGAGKSTFINSVQSVIRGRICYSALANSTQAEGTLGETFTIKYKIHRLKDEGEALLPFLISDIMGVESEESRGVRNDDVLKILLGKIKEGYKFHSDTSMKEEDPNSKPTLNDTVHCFVFVVSAESISLISDSVHTKMSEIRRDARELDIPQVVIMTNVDNACPLVKKDLKKIYTSKKIKEKILECHHKLGIPINYIFPVKNYCEEWDTNTETDILILTALTRIVNFANDFVEDAKEEKKSP